MIMKGITCLVLMAFIMLADARKKGHPQKTKTTTVPSETEADTEPTSEAEATSQEPEKNGSSTGLTTPDDLACYFCSATFRKICYLYCSDEEEGTPRSSLDMVCKTCKLKEHNSGFCKTLNRKTCPEAQAERDLPTITSINAKRLVITTPVIKTSKTTTEVPTKAPTRKHKKKKYKKTRGSPMRLAALLIATLKGKINEQDMSNVTLKNLKQKFSGDGVFTGDKAYFTNLSSIAGVTPESINWIDNRSQAIVTLTAKLNEAKVEFPRCTLKFGRMEKNGQAEAEAKDNVFEITARMVLKNQTCVGTVEKAELKNLKDIEVTSSLEEDSEQLTSAVKLLYEGEILEQINQKLENLVKMLTPFDCQKVIEERFSFENIDQFKPDM